MSAPKPPMSAEQVEQMRRNAQRIMETVRPLLENWPPPWLKDMQNVIVRAQEAIELYRSNIGPFWQIISKVALLHKLAARVEAAGFLPHYTTPFADLAIDQSDDEISDHLAAYYRDSWTQIAVAMADSMAKIDVDDEAKATFGEALRAHERGDFRCAPRLLFPEIERVVRDEFYPGDLKQRLASQIELRDAAESIPAGALSDELAAGLKLYQKLVEHLYAKVEDDVALARVAADPVPNRHAAVHGLVRYNAQKHSLNAIMMGEFAFHLVGVLKRFQREDGADSSV